MLPKKYEHIELSHVEIKGSKTIEHYHVWVKDRDEIRPFFRENEEPKKSKIKQISEFFGVKI